MQYVDNCNNQRVKQSHSYKQMPKPNEKPGQDLNSKILPLQFRVLLYFCSFYLLDGGPASSAGSTLPLLLPLVFLSLRFWDWNFINIIDVRAGKMSSFKFLTHYH